MRSRNIKPGFFKNERLADLPLECRLLFIGLWLLADRKGRLEDRPKRIKAELFPYDNRNVDKLLDKLYQAEFIVRYIVDDQAYISIPKFHLHQNPHKNERPSEIPAPDDFATLREQHSTNRADSLLLIPDSLSPDSLQKREAAERFDEFWQTYPKKVAKDRARESWAKAIDKVPAQTIVKAIKKLAPVLIANASEPRYIPMPSTWLNQERWTDEVEGGCITADDELDVLCKE